LASVFENARVWGNSQVNGTTQLTEDLYTEKTVEKLKETSGNLTEENTRLHQEVEILKTKLQTVLDIITK
jgi:regulator of replication initiation timing